MPFTFLNGLLTFVTAAAAGALGIVIAYLISRRRSRRVEFPSLQFLREVSRRRFRRMRIRQIFLLVLRVLIVLLAAIAVGRPAVRSAALGEERGPSTVFIFMDVSYSMGASARPSGAGAGGEGTLLTRAREKAHAVIDLLREQDRVQLVLVSDRADVRFEAPIQDLGRAHREVDRAALSMRTTQFAPAFEAAYGPLAHARTVNREIYVISDFQKSGWPIGESATAGASRAGANGASTAKLAVPEGTHIYLVPVTDEAIDNVAVAKVELLGEPSTGGADRVRASIENFTRRDLENLPVKVLSGGTVTGEALAEIPAEEPTWVDVALTGALGAGGAGEVRLPADRLPLDDVRYFASGSAELPRVLVVRPAGESEFLELALDPGGSGGPFRVRAVDQRDLGIGPKIDADVVVLHNVERLPEAGLAELSRFAGEEGGVLVVLGDRADLRYYNAELLPRLLPVTLRGVEGDPEDPSRYFSLYPKAVGHTLFDGFRIGPGERLSGSRFFRVVAASPGQGTRVLAEFGPGLPAILEGKRTVLVTSSFDQRWNNFATSGAFLPLLHRLIAHLAASGRLAGGLLVGEPLETTVPLDRITTPPVLHTPDGEERPVEMTRTASGALLRAGAAETPGVYRFASAGRRLSDFAVNLDVRESDLSAARVQDVERLFGEKVGVISLRPEAKIERSLLEARHGKELWRPFLLAALALMILETILGRSKTEE